VLTCTCPVVLNKNSEIVSMAMLSEAVTFAGMKVCAKNELLAGVGSTSCIAGGVISLTVKLVLSVLLRLLLVSFAIIVMLYSPIGSVNSGTKVALKISPESKVMVKSTLLPFALVIFANTTFTPMLSVTLTVMLVLCVWLMMFGSAVRLMTSGTVISNTVKFVVSVLFTFPEVSFAMMVTL